MKCKLKYVESCEASINDRDRDIPENGGEWQCYAALKRMVKVEGGGGRDNRSRGNETSMKAGDTPIGSCHGNEAPVHRGGSQGMTRYSRDSSDEGMGKDPSARTIPRCSVALSAKV